MTKIAGSGSESRSISQEAWIRGSGSTPKCHGSGTLEDTNLLVLLPELLLLLVASLHVHLVHAQALEVRTVLIQKLKKTRDFLKF
jgi:hypothetical protein